MKMAAVAVCFWKALVGSGPAVACRQGRPSSDAWRLRLSQRLAACWAGRHGLPCGPPLALTRKFGLTVHA